MITELDVDVLPLTREGQIIGTVMSHPQFQLEEFKAYLDPWPTGCRRTSSGRLPSAGRSCSGSSTIGATRSPA
jgi:hypothetical protein